MVGLAVLARVAPIILASGPSLASTCGAAAGVNSRPSASLAASMNACAEGVSRVGHSWRPIRATVSASSVTALSLWSREPCPAVPRAVSRSQAMPFSAVCTRYRRWPPMVALNPPTSLIASVTPSNRCAWLSTSHRPPQFPPASSSARKASTTSRGGRRPSRIRCLTTARVMASMSFMSTAPRPQIVPSWISPEKGGTAQSAASAGTTSRAGTSARLIANAWRLRMATIQWSVDTLDSLGAGPRTVYRRVTTLARPEWDSSTTGSRPTSLSRAATCSAAGRSPGPE